MSPLKDLVITLIIGNGANDINKATLAHVEIIINNVSLSRILKNMPLLKNIMNLK
jgi:hypothetical protein